jgi:hypothetical protein
MIVKRNLELEDAFVRELGAGVDFGDNEGVGAVLNALAALFKATGDEKFSAAVRSVADKAMEKCSLSDVESLTNFEYGKGMYSAFAATGDAKYRDEAKRVAAQLATQPRYEDGIFKGSADGGEIRPCRTYMFAPFYMTYETLDGGKERYNDIIAQIRAMRKSHFDEYIGRLTAEKSTYNMIAHFSAAMVDTMEVMDQMLYEIYHEMLDYYREAVKAIAESGVVQGKGTKADYVYGYAVLKGCRMKALHTEKYEDSVIGLVDKLSSDLTDTASCGSDAAVNVCGGAGNVYKLAFKALFYSEAVRNREYQDYGRGKGGVLWS